MPEALSPSMGSFMSAASGADCPGAKKSTDKRMLDNMVAGTLPLLCLAAIAVELGDFKIKSNCLWELV